MLAIMLLKTVTQSFGDMLIRSIGNLETGVDMDKTVESLEILLVEDDLLIR